MLRPIIRGVADDQRESFSVLKSVSQAREDDFRREIETTALDVAEIRHGITTTQRQTDDLQVTNRYVNSTLETKLEDLPKLKEGIEMLPELLKKELRVNFERHWQKTCDMLLNSQLHDIQRNAAMQDHVCVALFQIPKH